MLHSELPLEEVVETTADTWGYHLQAAGCLHCERTYLIEGGRIGQVCPTCASGPLETQPALLRHEPPERIIPFAVNRAKLETLLSNFIKPVLLRASDLTLDMLMERIIPVYWPMWLVDSDVIGTWEAEVGFDYEVKSSQESYRSGDWTSHDVIETRVRWEPRLGQLLRHYDNIAVPALSDHHTILAFAGEYMPDQATLYDPSHLHQSDLRVPDIHPDNAWPLAQQGLARVAAEECRQAASAQHIRTFSLQADCEQINWSQLLHPLYVTHYADDAGTPCPIYINGQTGTIGGMRLASPRKGWILTGLLFTIAVGLFVLGMVLVTLQEYITYGNSFGALCIMLALLTAVFAATPAVAVWQWNRKQREQYEQQQQPPA